MASRKPCKVLLVIEVVVLACFAVVCCGDGVDHSPKQCGVSEELRPEATVVEKAKKMLGSWTEWSSEKHWEAFELMKISIGKRPKACRGTLCLSFQHLFRDLVLVCCDLVLLCWALVYLCGQLLLLLCWSWVGWCLYWVSLKIVGIA